MCIGIPMRIVESDEMSALCERLAETGREKRRFSLLLIGPQPVGTYVLTHLDTAIRVLDEDEARQIEAALEALAAALRGEDTDRYFEDLANREPQLPPHLRG
jgi:hydrogenase expression/formation protein HypC